MANPTTNYGFVLPTSADLVTDLPADFDVALQGVDTRLKALNPSTTLGDTDYASATANTNTRLAIGSNGQVLTVAGGVPTWSTPAGAGGMTLLSTTSLTGATTTISSIDQTYVNLQVVISGVTNATSNGSKIRIAPNSSTTLSYTYNSVNDGATVYVGSLNGEYIRTSNFNFSNSASTNIFVLQIYNYASSTAYKEYLWNWGVQESTTFYRSIGSGYFASNTAISSLQFSCDGGNMSTGTVLVYGVK